MKLKFAIFALGLFGQKAFAQLPAQTDIWVFELEYDTKSQTYKAGTGSNVSNNPGYDNQPMFSPASDYLLYSSDRGKGQTDIYRYDFYSHKNEVFKETPESEFSPSFMDGSKYISTVVVEADSSQHLWRYHKDSKQAVTLLPKVDSIGYHGWLDDRTVFMFILTQPFSLVMGDVKNGQTKHVADSIGRSMMMYRSPVKKYLLFTQIQADGKMLIKASNGAGVIDKSFKPVPVLEGSQDFTIDNRGNLLMAKGAKLYSWKIDGGKEWKEVADFSFSGVKNITRLNISRIGNKIAVVENTN